MAYTTSHSVASGSPTELWSRTNDGGVGPIEWTIYTDQTIDLTWEGPFPNGESVTITAAESPYTVADVNRSWQSISAEAASTTATVLLIPTIV